MHRKVNSHVEANRKRDKKNAGGNRATLPPQKSSCKPDENHRYRDCDGGKRPPGVFQGWKQVWD